MSDAKKKVLEMVAQRKITAAEGDALLAAMRAEGKFVPRLLIDPFGRLTTGTMLAVGAVSAILSAVAAAALGIRYDGFLDLHGPAGAVPVALAIAEQVVAWPLSAMALWLVALPFARGARAIDFLAVTGFVRILYLVFGAAIAAVAPGPEAVAGVLRHAMTSPASVVGDLASMIPLIVVGLLLAGWSITMLVFGFRHASGLRGGRLAGVFVAALIAAEIVSKLALWAVSACGV